MEDASADSDRSQIVLTPSRVKRVDGQQPDGLADIDLLRYTVDEFLESHGGFGVYQRWVTIQSGLLWMWNGACAVNPLFLTLEDPSNGRLDSIVGEWELSSADTAFARSTFFCGWLLGNLSFGRFSDL